MIRPARPEDLPGIKRLWMQAFHDSEAATDFYFDHRMPRADLLDCLLVDTQGTDLRGMLSLLPAAKMLGAMRTLQKPFTAPQLLEAVGAELQLPPPTYATAGG